eukprot:TRINITY_DN7722_c0_g1_i1.p1 TRINITY_DN7722_c0_g1~~TRINITY_DN7722_c0_g1_i1.p1  ORF type:complete len:196 (+),score=70.54 TRINITY_DN7722_c0_g1_i1:50-589(+)
MKASPFLLRPHDSGVEQMVNNFRGKIEQVGDSDRSFSHYLPISQPKPYLLKQFIYDNADNNPVQYFPSHPLRENHRSPQQRMASFGLKEITYAVLPATIICTWTFIRYPFDFRTLARIKHSLLPGLFFGFLAQFLVSDNGVDYSKSYMPAAIAEQHKLHSNFQGKVLLPDSNFFAHLDK